MVLLCKANGRSEITEKIFENRFMHASGAPIEWEQKLIFLAIKLLLRAT